MAELATFADRQAVVLASRGGEHEPVMGRQSPSDSMVSRCWSLLALAGCAEDAALTELVLSADSKLTLHEITFELSAEGAPMRSATAGRTGTGPSIVASVPRLQHGPPEPAKLRDWRVRPKVTRSRRCNFVPR